MPQSDSQVYHASMRHYNYGYGLFQPETMSKLRPGMCGYVDESGRWQPLLDLTDNKLLAAAGYTLIGPLQKSDSETQAWEPRVASTVKSVKVDIDGDASALSAGLPIDASLAIKYSTSTNFGAILMCDDKVTVECYDHRDPFRAWLKRNAEKLLMNHPSLKKHGIYIATTTYSSSNIHINVWQSPHDEITLGFKAGVTGIGKVGPSVTWMRGRTTHGWTDFGPEKGPRVMFFGGIKVIFRSLYVSSHARAKEVPQGEWRGEGARFSGRDPNGESWEAEMEMLGDGPQDRELDEEEEDGG